MTSTMPKSYDLVYERVRSSSQFQASAGYCQLSFQAMNTHCRVNFVCADPVLANKYNDQILRWISWFESHYSRFIADSLISRINAAAGQHWVEVDAETDALFSFCQEMVFFTKGLFDPTSLPLIRLWNWKVKPAAVPSEQAVASALELVGWRKIQRRSGGIFLPREGMCLDLGGLGKEYAVDRVLTMGLEAGITNLLVDFGQDVRVHGKPPDRAAWHIGLEDPNKPGDCWTGLAVTNHAVATSGDYVRNFRVGERRYGHIIDPRDGYPVNNGCLAVSIVAPSCTMAGILSTSVFILGAQQGLDLIRFCPGVEGAIVTNNVKVHTRNFYAYATK